LVSGAERNGSRPEGAAEIDASGVPVNPSQTAGRPGGLDTPGGASGEGAGPSGGGLPVAVPPVGATSGAPAEFPPASPAGRGMFGISGSGDTSGFGGLVRTRPDLPQTPRPYGGYFDEVHDALQEAYPAFSDAIEHVVVDRGELTLHVRPERIVEVCQVLRDDESLRFEFCSSVSGVDYLGSDARRLHVVYQLTSMTYRRRIRLEVAVSTERPQVPSVTGVYPTADWQERETYDMFGVVFTGHPALTRILMPDDWEGHPQRKDYPLGGVPVEYKGAEIPPPDQRRSYQ
jgi:NADH-quinone oxidoreductase subunit C